MILIILIAFISLIGLIVLHEFGHFILAKKFGVKVEEFGIGIPPRIFGKKFGETIYSINLLPIGAFVKLYGEEEEIKDSRSFSSKSIWQRALIVLGGVISFWIIAIILLSIVMSLGAPTTISDEQNNNLINPEIQIVGISPASPAEEAGLKMGDKVIEVKTQEIESKSINKVKELQEFTEINKGKEIILIIQRGEEIFEVPITPRLSPPEGEGYMGVGLIRIATIKYPWYKAPFKGILATGDLTLGIIKGWAKALNGAISGSSSGVQIVGPVGIFSLFTQISQLGMIYFIQFIAVIAIHLGLFNLLPIPALDGGKMLFLGIEKIKGEPIPEKIEQNLTAFFFILLIALMIWITIKDIIRIL